MKMAVWKSGKALLAKHGIDTKKAGTILGAWRRDHGDATLLNVLGRAELEVPTDIVEFIAGCLKHAPRANGSSRPVERKPSQPAAGTPEWHKERREAGIE